MHFIDKTSLFNGQAIAWSNKQTNMNELYLLKNTK